MGRSRAVRQPAEDDPSQSRSKRKRTTSSIENIEPATEGQGLTDGKKALYHCNYCNKDISGKIRIKCAVCPDYDLCIECFSVGAEVTPHKSNHPYRVMDNLSFPLICPDWNADEETLLLEGIEMYGLSNWSEVSEHVGTKSKSQCIEHYYATYASSPCFPLPDLSHVVGKNREELLAMANEQANHKKAPVHGEIPEAESAFSTKVKIEEQMKDTPAERSLYSLKAEGGSTSVSGAVTKESDKALHAGRSDIKVEDRSIGEKKPRAADEAPTITDLTGYNAKRQEFEVEYDNDAEQLLAEMEFKDTDTEAERGLKLQVLRIYSRRLDERKRRKDFILQRNLLYPDPFLKSLSPEEREICQRYRVFMRFHSQEEHEQLLRNVIEEHRIQKRIQELQMARAAGCQTSAQAERYIGQKRKREAEENSMKVKESVDAGPTGKVLGRLIHTRAEFNGSPRGSGRGATSFDCAVKDSSSITDGKAFASFLNEWDIDILPGADLLCETERQLCRQMRILPLHYLSMLQIMSVEVIKGNIRKKSDAHNLFKVDPSKVDTIYDMLVKKGIAQQ